MSSEKYTRSVRLLCPTCGSSDFAFGGAGDETIQVMTCASCERELHKDELIQENSESIEAHLSEIKAEISKDFAEELKKTFKKAFSGNKNIRFK